MMIRKMARTISPFLIAVTFFAAFNQTALAGTPLICHPFDIGGAKSLPWGGGAWTAIKKDYNINRLADDTLALLDSDMPVIARMETLRRAAVYAMKDRGIAIELRSRLAARSQKARGKAGALALFDLGYLEETCKQLARNSGNMSFAKNLDGYSSVVKAIELRGGDAEMEFAAALIAAYPLRASHEEHFRRAAIGAKEGSLLARNLVTHFGDRGRTIAEIRARLGIAKN